MNHSQISFLMRKSEKIKKNTRVSPFEPGSLGFMWSALTKCPAHVNLNWYGAWNESKKLGLNFWYTCVFFWIPVRLILKDWLAELFFLIIYDMALYGINHNRNTLMFKICIQNLVNKIVLSNSIVFYYYFFGKVKDTFGLLLPQRELKIMSIMY